LLCPHVLLKIAAISAVSTIRSCSIIQAACHFKNATVRLRWNPWKDTVSLWKSRGRVATMQQNAQKDESGVSRIWTNRTHRFGFQILDRCFLLGIVINFGTAFSRSRITRASESLNKCSSWWSW
jgi:hypothetical protein